MATETDFSKLSRFPGETGNVLDNLLHGFEIIERIPTVIFSGILFIMAGVATRFTWAFFAILSGFFLLDWVILALLPRWRRSFGPAKPPVLILAAFRSIFALLPFPLNLIIQPIGTLLVIYGFWIEPHRLGVTHQALVTAKLPQGCTLRILHLGDLHMERITARERQLQIQIEQLAPDIILFSGDILNLSYRNDPVAIDQARKVMEKWKAPMGVYLVSGSPAVDLAENMPSILQGLPLKWMQSDRISIPLVNGKIELVGLTCSHRPHLDGPVLEDLVPATPENFTVLVYHTPDLAPIASRLGIDLMVSGHTHGGQVRLPGFGALVTGSLYGKQFEAGRKQIGAMTLYVTRGIGLEGAAAPRVRLFCPPEIILWEIQGRGAVISPPAGSSPTG